MQAACGKMCRHIERGVNLDKLCAQLSKSKLSLSQCEDCFNDKTGAGKESKSRSSQKKAARLTAPVHTAAHQEENWVCLACGHVGCGVLLDHQNFDGEAENIKRGENGAPTSGHAWKHSVLAKHPLAMQAGGNLVYWCFICNMPVEYPMPEGLPLLNTHDNLQLGSWRNPLHEAAEVVRERLSKKKGSLKDSTKMRYTMDPVRCVIDTVRCVIDTATNLKTMDVGNPNTQFTGSGRKCSVKGLMNLGNTCFLNSILQNLLALSVLRDHFSQEPRDSEGPLTSSLRSLYQEINPELVPVSVYAEHGLKRSWKGPNNSEKVCNPRSLFDAICAKAPRFRGFQQQDSHELLRYLLEGLNLEEQSAKALPNGEYKKALSKVPGQNGQSGDLESAEEDGEQGATKKVTQPPQVIPTFVESVFGGQLSSTVHCCECGHVSVVYETMLDLSLQIPTRQILKKRQACENQRELSLFGERADSKPVEPVQMMDTQETVLASTGTFFDDKFSIHDFDALDSGGGGLQSAECSSEETLWGMVSASADGVPSGFLQREKICVESLTTNAFEQPQDKHVLIDSKDAPSAPSVLLQPYGHLDVASDCRQVEISRSIDVATECTYDKSLCIEGKGLSSPELKTKECFQSSSQLLEGTETLFDINPETEASKGHMEGELVTSKSTSIGEGDGGACDTAKGAEKSEQCIDDEDNVSPSSLEACLADFIKSELLCGDNAWECENCFRLTEEKAHSLASENKLKTRDGHLFIELMVDSKDLGKDLSEQKDEKDAFSDAEVSVRTSSGSMEGDSSLPAVGDHKVEEIHSGANLTTQGGDLHNGGDCFAVEVDNDHVNITQMLADVCTTDQKNELGTGELNIHDKSGGAQSSMVEKSFVPHPLVKKYVPPEGHGLAHTCSKMLPNLRKEKLSFFSGFFSKTENHKVKIGQPQKFVKRNATKKFLISRAPLVLTVHLKRFAQDARGRINKLCGHVTFSEFLDLQPFLDPRCLDYNNCVYRLVSIVEHGGTMRGGHYVAFVRGPCVEESSDTVDRDKDSWYHISDSIVQKSTLQEVLGREAYLLFYERQNVKEER